MNLGTDSVTSFSATDPNTYEVMFAGVDAWTLPVIGFATVITYAAKDDGEHTDAAVSPVILTDDGNPLSVLEYLRDWSPEDRPGWTLRFKQPSLQRLTACPSCGKAALYAPALDRHLHTDGSDNQDCWRQIVRGQDA